MDFFSNVVNMESARKFLGAYLKKYGEPPLEKFDQTVPFPPLPCRTCCHVLVQMSKKPCETLTCNRYTQGEVQ